MPQVNMLEAKTKLSKLVESIESGKEMEIVLARDGKPVARIVPLHQPQNRRLGIAEGEFGALDEAWFREFQALDLPIREVFQKRLDKIPPLRQSKPKKLR